jgi:hypothetical protein
MKRSHWSLLAIIAAAFSDPADAQYLVCPSLQATSYADCLKESKTTVDRRECAAMVQSDMAEVDEWQRCQLEVLDQRFAKERQALLDQAALRRKLITMRLGTNSR